MFTFALFSPLFALIGWKFATMGAGKAGGLKEQENSRSRKTQGVQNSRSSKQTNAGAARNKAAGL